MPYAPQAHLGIPLPAHRNTGPWYTTGMPGAYESHVPKKSITLPWYTTGMLGAGGQESGSEKKGRGGQALVPCLMMSWWNPSSQRNPRGKKERLGTAVKSGAAQYFHHGLCHKPAPGAWGQHTGTMGTAAG